MRWFSGCDECSVKAWNVILHHVDKFLMGPLHGSIAAGVGFGVNQMFINLEEYLPTHRKRLFVIAVIE